MGSALQENSRLQRLDLARNLISDAGVTALCESLAKNSTLQHLSLMANQFALVGAKAIGALLRSANCALRSLDLYGNTLIGAEGVAAISDGLAKNTTLSALDLYSCNAHVAGALALSNALRSNRSLTTLGLKCNSLGAAGAQHLANALAHNTSLLRLNLDRNELGTAGVAALHAVLVAQRQNKTLTQLSLFNNALEPTSTLPTDIAAALSANKLAAASAAAAATDSKAATGSTSAAAPMAIASHTIHIIPAYQLQVTRVVGAGSFGTAYLVQWNRALLPTASGSADSKAAPAASGSAAAASTAAPQPTASSIQTCVLKVPKMQPVPKFFLQLQYALLTVLFCKLREPLSGRSCKPF